MMNGITVGTLLLMLWTAPLLGGTPEGRVPAGTMELIQSDVLGEERHLQIYLPASYSGSEDSYPVLYLLDGQRWYHYGVILSQLFSEYDLAPEFIVVGIPTADSSRYGFFADSERLLSFLRDDVFATVEARYRGSDQRLLFGWQFAGAFAIQVLAEHPGLFDAVFAASPIPLGDGLIQNVEDYLQSGVRPTQTLFFVSGESERQVGEGAARLADLLGAKAPAPLNWAHRVVDHETIPSRVHRTTPFATLYQGLREHYHDYPVLEFGNLEAYEVGGGFNGVLDYYQRRADRYGLPTEIPHEGMFFLVRLGLDEGHFPTFQRFMDAFAKSGFLEGVNLGWGTRYAEFYLENGRYDAAKQIYEILARRFPDEARPVHGLGRVSEARGEIERARVLFGAAVALATASGDSRLERYEADLSNLSSREVE